MFAAEPDQYMAAAILATDAASSMEFSEEMLLKSLSWPITNETKRQEFRLAADVRNHLGGPQVTAPLAAIYEAFPRSLVELNPYLAAYKNNFRLLIESVRKNLASEAIQWARTQLDTNPAEAASLCATDPASLWFRDASDVLYCGSPSSLSSRKKFDRRMDRFFSRMNAKMPRIAAKIKEHDLIHDPDACVEIAAEELFGHMRPIMFYTLAMMYGQYIILGLMLAGGASPFLLAETAEETLVDDDDFCDSILQHSSVLQELGPIGRVLSLSGFEAACEMGSVIMDHLDAGLTLAHFLRTQQDAQLRAQRQWESREKELNRTINKQNKTISDLQQGSAKDAMQALLKDLAAARADAAKLRATLAQNEERLLTLENLRVAKPTRPTAEPQTSGREPPSPAPKEITPDEALGILGSLKCVLVGGHPTFHAKIAESLPHWSLFDADQIQIDDSLIESADLVVFFTSHASHAQTQNVLKRTRQLKIPVVYAYKVNPALFFVEVAKQVQRLPAQTARGAAGSVDLQ